MDDSLAALQAEVIAFRDARDWSHFHRAKDLVLGLVAEAGELAEVVLWREPEVLERIAEDPELKRRLGEEMADVFVYLAVCKNNQDDEAGAVADLRRALEIAPEHAEAARLLSELGA